jgi:hypothetical protein
MLADPGGGGAFEGISTAVGGIVAAADAGFMISENGGQPLVDAIDELKKEVAKSLANVAHLEQQPPLGSTPNAKVYKPYLATVASDPTQGAVPVLRKLQDDLNNAEAAIKKAMANYGSVDHGNASNLNNSGIPA